MKIFEASFDTARQLYCDLIGLLIDVTSRLPFAVFFVLFLLFGP